MELQRKKGVSLWRQIHDWIEYRIAEKELKPGDRLPTEQDFARMFGVNRHTVRRALAALEERELIRTEQGSGSYVREQVIDYAVGRRTRFHENLLRQQRRPRGELIAASVVPATSAVAEALALARGEEVIVLETLGAADGTPVTLAKAYFPQKRFAGLDGHYRRTGSVTLSLKEYGVDDYRRKVTAISARMPSARDARLLRQPGNRPVLVAEALNVDTAGRPIEYCITRFASDRIQIVMES